MTILADDDVIMNGDPQRFGGISTIIFVISISAREGVGSPGRVIMNENKGGGRQFQSALDHFARIDRRVIDGPCLLHFVGDQRIALVEEENAELLAGLVRHGGMAVLDHRRPGGENLLALEIAF